MGAREAKAAGYLCGDCAAAHGGVWPAGHVATFHEGDCPLCGKTTMLSAWDDWDWPGNSMDEAAKDSREW